MVIDSFVKSGSKRFYISSTAVFEGIEPKGVEFLKRASKDGGNIIKISAVMPIPGEAANRVSCDTKNTDAYIIEKFFTKKTLQNTFFVLK